MEIDHYSKEWDDAPMPYSIFFTKSGNAVHGTHERRHLGHAVSHGCVRLSVKNAATLWELVKQEKMDNTTVVVTD
jgi:lipoprotein-anchoring transpeptidase ErfK/SrfK